MRECSRAGRSTNARITGVFRFDASMHEPGSKTILGHAIRESGEREGLEAVHMLAHHPSTAKFVCTKIAQRFVSDDPPKALVDRMAATFLKEDGDIREVLRTLFRSDEFWAPAAYRAKVKTPLEFVVSSVRATGAEVHDAAPLIREMSQLGMPLYGMPAPTGYSMKADAWVNSAALLGRVNFAISLTSDKLPGVVMPPDTGPMAGGAAVSTMERNILGGDVSAETHQTIVARTREAEGASEGEATRWFPMKSQH